MAVTLLLVAAEWEEQGDQRQGAGEQLHLTLWWLCLSLGQYDGK